MRHQGKLTDSRRSGAPLLCAAIFFLMMTAAVVIGKLPSIVPGFYLAVSAATFIVYGIDKSAARNDRWRTQESTLHLLALACGWPGALAAQYLLRHKSKKVPFLRMFWVTATLNVGALCWLIFAQRAEAIRTLIDIDIFR